MKSRTFQIIIVQYTIISTYNYSNKYLKCAILHILNQNMSFSTLIFMNRNDMENLKTLLEICINLVTVVEYNRDNKLRTPITFSNICHGTYLE